MAVNPTQFVTNILVNLNALTIPSGSVKIEGNVIQSVLGNMGLTSDNNLKKIVEGILEKSKRNFNDGIDHKGVRILAISNSDELKARFAAVFVAATINKEPTEDNLRDAAISNLYNEINPIKIKTYFELVTSDPTYEFKFEAWDKRVEEIKDALANVSKDGIKSEIDDDHLVLSPIKTFMKPGDLKVDVRKVNSWDPRAVYIKRNPQVIVNVRNPIPMKGGNNNPHAPLFPSVVMNGGAHPLATLEGGDMDVQIISPKTDYLLKQFEGLTKNTNVHRDLKQSINEYRNEITGASKDLYKQIDEIKNINLAVASKPLGLGYPEVKDMTIDQFKNLAKLGEEINKKSERLAKRVTKWDEIIELLEKLVKNQLPYGSA